MASKITPTMSEINASLNHLPVSDEVKHLVRASLFKGTLMNFKEIQRVWKATIIDPNALPGFRWDIFWIETGNENAGWTHMLKHKEQFASQGVSETQLAELAEAATTVGKYIGQQSKQAGAKPRAIFVLYFYDKPLAVAISIGTNGFLFGMNPRAVSKDMAKAGLSNSDLLPLHGWPKV